MAKRIISLCLSLMSVEIIQSNLHDVTDKEIDVNNIQFGRNKDHLKTHLKYLDADYMNNISEKETEFLFFNMHDYNKDKRLDGLEILSFLLHDFSDNQDFEDAMADPRFADKSEEEINEVLQNRYSRLLDHASGILDKILASSDSNNDGYLDYVECSQAGGLERLTVEKKRFNDDNGRQEQEQKQHHQKHEQ